MPLGSLDVTIAPGARAKVLRVESTPGDDSGWWLHSLCPAPGYVAAVAYPPRSLSLNLPPRRTPCGRSPPPSAPSCQPKLRPTHTVGASSKCRPHTPAPK